MTYRAAPPVRRQAFLLLFSTFVAGLATALLLAGGAAAEPTLAGKRAQAQAVLAQVEAIDMEVGRAAEAYNLASIKLDRIRGEQSENEARLKLARKNLAGAQRRLAERLVAIYTSGGGGSAMDVLLGATSVEDLLNRIDTVERVTTQDADVLNQVTSFRDQVKVREARLTKARAAQERVVEQRVAHRRAVEEKLRERQALLVTIKNEIAEIEARERARQLELQRQARARLAAARRAQAARSAPAAAAAPATVVEQPAESEPVSAEASPTPASNPSPPPARHGGVVGIAMKYLGIPYRWGGSSPKTGFDCSGFVMYVYAQVGVSLPHNAAMQYGYGRAVPKSALAPGDLVFFNGLGHNGIYIGGGQFIHSPRTGDVVKISSLSDSWYARTYVGAKRL